MSDEHAKGYIRNAFSIGSSIGITLPSWFVKQHNIEAGTQISIIERDMVIELRVVSKEQFEYTLRANYIDTNVSVKKTNSSKNIKKG